MVIGGAHGFPGFLTPELTQLPFPKPPTTFLTCFSRGGRRNYAGKKVCHNKVSSSKLPSHESDTLTTKPPGRGMEKGEKKCWKHFNIISIISRWPVHLFILVTSHGLIFGINHRRNNESSQTDYHEKKLAETGILLVIPTSPILFAIN